jgi:type IV pilus assembly protein PilW
MHLRVKKMGIENAYPTSKQRGLSLVELMVAMGLSVLIIAALAELFVRMSQSNQEMAKTSSQIENARFSVQFIGNDLIHAGFWDSFIPTFDDLVFPSAPIDYPASVPDPCLAYAPWTDTEKSQFLSLPLQVTSGAPGTCNALLPNKLANTDVLVVRHANNCVVGDINCEANVANQLYFQASNCEIEIDSDDYYQLDSNPAVFTLRKVDCTAGGAGTVEDRRKFIQNIYYVRDYADTIGDGIPTLMRSEFGVSGTTPTQLAATPLVTGIERFRVELAIDSLSETLAAVDDTAYAAKVNWLNSSNRTTVTNRGDGRPDPQAGDFFVHCGTGCSVAQLANTVAVKISILARADEESAGYTDTKDYILGGAAAIGPFNDSFKRHVFSSTVRMNNIAGRRETP